MKDEFALGEEIGAAQAAIDAVEAALKKKSFLLICEGFYHILPQMGIKTRQNQSVKQKDCQRKYHTLERSFSAKIKLLKMFGILKIGKRVELMCLFELN